VTRLFTEQGKKETQAGNTHLCLLMFALLLTISNPIVASDAIQLKEAQWLSKQSNKALALTRQPTECLNPKAPAIASIGRIAFQSPALLGGQATRMGLSCASCHPSGRSNADFFLNTVSSDPGTADVTHHFFSSKGGNNTLTAVMIPDLANLDQAKIKDRWSTAFQQKLVQLIEVEFDGQTAPPTILNGLQTYLANTDIKFCEQDTIKTIDLLGDWTHLIDTVNALPLYPNSDTNTFLIRAARKQIEQIYLRFKNINSKEIDDALISLSRQLEQASLRVISHQEQIKNLNNWEESAQLTYSLLKHKQSKSTYNPEVIKDLLAR